MNTPPSQCFHNGIILIVICFQICVDKYTYNFLILLYDKFFYVYILNIIIP